jgi:hypothetical protein
MGQFRVEIVAVGGHGCERDRKDGEQVYGCNSRNCPDCITREFLETLQRKGSSIEKAELIHWPGSPSEVRDDLLTRKRTGSF